MFPQLEGISKLRYRVGTLLRAGSNLFANEVGDAVANGEELFIRALQSPEFLYRPVQDSPRRMIVD